ncbi:voltage-dependent calcium channel gamma-4 [Sarotherodon galilaeus]
MAGHKELLFTAQECNLLKEMVDILKSFGEATDLTQGEKIIRISAVVPSVLSLNHHLEKLKPQVRFLNGLLRSLQALNKRVLGIFISVRMARAENGITAPFSDPVYLKAAALDPAFSLLWVEHHVLGSCDIKTELTQNGGLFAAYCKRQKKDMGTSPALQLSDYLDIADGQNALLFWFWQYLHAVLQWSEFSAMVASFYGLIVYK